MITPTPTQAKRLPFIKSRFEAWKHLPFIISAEWFGEPYDNGTLCARVAWQYGKDGNARLDGSALITVGTRGAMRIIYATDGLRSKEAETVALVSIMAGIPAKSLKAR